MLKDFYSIQETTKVADGFVAKIQLNKKHKIYEGHFPGNPVVPGVCLVQIIKELVEKAVYKKMRLVKADNIKFMNFVNPEINDTLFLDISINKETFQTKATIAYQEKVFLKFGGSFL